MSAVWLYISTIVAARTSLGKSVFIPVIWPLDVMDLLLFVCSRHAMMWMEYINAITALVRPVVGYAT
jgi:hypothetical protein